MNGCTCQGFGAQFQTTEVKLRSRDRSFLQKGGSDPVHITQRILKSFDHTESSSCNNYFIICYISTIFTVMFFTSGARTSKSSIS